MYTLRGIELRIWSIGPKNSCCCIKLEGVVTFFGRVAILIDQNTQAFHMFITALLQLLDRSGLLYGELARFVLRLLGIRTKPKKCKALMSIKASFSNIANVLLDWDDVHNDDFFANWRPEESTIHGFSREQINWFIC
ncbi:unnamed protein product [Camellia sinensis]